MASRKPFVVAHRAGNDLALLPRAEALPQVRLIEADVHLHRGRLEVRHLKTLGPLPVLWDKWIVVPATGPRLLVAELLARSTATTELMLDLKGRDPRLSDALMAELDAAAHPRVTVCSQCWPLLAPLSARPDVRIVHSVGGRRALRALPGAPDAPLAGISIHRRLLDPATTARLRERTEMLLTWPVNDPEEAVRLAGWGVDGVISTGFEHLAAALEAQP